MFRYVPLSVREIRAHQYSRRDDLDVHLVVMFSTLLFLKCFHWISTDRVDYVSRDV